MNLQILFWIFIGIFSLTAIITLLGITGVIKSIKDKYLNALFGALIIEVVAAVVGVFKGIDIQEMTAIPETIFEKTALQHGNDIHEDTDLIIRAINDSEALKTYQTKAEDLELKLEECNGSLKELDKDFYSYIIKLRNAMNKYPERSININFQPDQKQAEYEMLKNIFIILDEFEDPNNVSIEEIKAEWLAFKTRHGRAEDNTYHILEYDITLLVRDFLNKFYPLSITNNLL